MAVLVRRAGRGRERPTSGAYLIAGLGNPERRYACNRHNIGFQCVDLLAERHGVAVTRRRFQSLFGEGRISEQRVALLKPQTYMNDSGRAVGPAARWYKVTPERLLVIYDDLDLPLGRLRIRLGGSSGGHHGINSIMEALGHGDFVRLRVGIGRPERGRGDPIDYVLQDFTPEQCAAIAEARERVAEAVAVILAEGVTEAMNRFNGL